MYVELPTRLILVSRDQDGQIIDYFLGPYSSRVQEALAIAHTLLTARRSRLARVEVHPYEHSISHYTQKPLAVLAREDLEADIR